MKDSFPDRNTRTTGFGMLALAVLAVVGLVLLGASPFGCGGDSGDNSEGGHAQVATDESAAPADARPSAARSERAATGAVSDGERTAAPSAKKEQQEASAAKSLQNATASAMRQQDAPSSAPAEPAAADEPQPGTESSAAEGKPSTPPSISFATAESLYHARRFDEAAAAFDAYTQRHPDNAWGFYMLGLSRWKSGELEQAEKALRATIERDQDHVKSHVNLARVLLDDQRPRQALAEAKTAVMLAADQPAVQRTLGRCHHALGEYEDAAAAYRRAIHLDPQDVWAFNNLGLLYIEQERFEEALPALAHAVLLRDDVAEFQNNLGVALERTGYLLDAAEAYAKALEADQSYAKAAVSLARVEERSAHVSSPRTDLQALADRYDAEPAGSAEQAADADSAGPDGAFLPEGDEAMRDTSTTPEVDLSPIIPPTQTGLAQSDTSR